MKTRCKYGLHVSVAIFVLLFALAGDVWAKPVSITFSGTGYDTTVDNLNDGLAVNVSIAEARGSFGASRAEISAEFFPNDADCDAGYEMELGILFSASIITFQNHDQLFGVSNDGWMCVDMDAGHYYGQATGQYIGGTGRFEGATGEWVTDFDGQRMEPPGLTPIGFRSISGTVNGEVVLP